MPFSAQHIKAGRLHLQSVDPIMKRIIRQVGPFTAKAKRDRFSVLVTSILVDPHSLFAARSILDRMQKKPNVGMEDSEPTLEQLTPTELLQFDQGKLCQFGMSAQQATRVLDLANNVECGRLDLNALDQLDDESATQYLIQFPEIDLLTTQMLLIFSLARLDILPLDDPGIQHAIQRQYELDRSPTRSAIEQLAGPWRPYATIACWYLWQTLET